MHETVTGLANDTPRTRGTAFVRGPLERRARAAALAALLASAVALSACGDSPEAMLGKAKDLIAKQDNKAAEIQLKAVIQKQDSPEARYLLGTVHSALGDYASAEKEYQRALDGGFDQTKASVGYIDSLFKLGRFKDVIAQGSKASISSPQEKASVETLIGRSQLAQNKPDEATANFKAAMAAVPDFPPARVAMISLQAARGDLAGAGSEVDKVIAGSPTFVDALALKGDIEAAQGHRKEAADWYRKATATDPKERLTRAKLAALDIELGEYAAAQKSLDELKKLAGPGIATAHLQALLFKRQNKIEQAREAIQFALKIGPDYPPTLALGAQIFLDLKNYEQAESLARKTIERVPQSSIGYRMLAASLLATGAPDKAVATVQAAVDKGVKDPVLYNLAGEASLQLNDPTKAIGYFDQAGKLDPKGASPKTGIAVAHMAKGEKDRGIGELEAVAEANANDTRADQILVATYLRDKQYGKALAVIDRLEKKLPNSPLAANMRGTVLLAKEDVPGARKAYEDALTRDPGFMTAVNNLASLDLRERKIDDAKARFTKVLEKNPKSVDAMLALARIEQGAELAARAEKERADAKAGKLIEIDPAKAVQAGSPAALEWLKKARETDRASVNAALALSGWYMRSGQPKEAIPLLQEALATSPDRIELLDALGTAYMRTDQSGQAMEQFEKILKVKPDSAVLQYRMGQLRLSRKEYPAALTHLKKSIELEPKALEPRVALAAALVRSGKPDDAKAVALTLQKDYPKSPAGAMLEGDVAVAVRKFPEAIAAYRKAVAIEKTITTQIKLNDAIAASGQTAEADAAVRALVKASPDDMTARGYAGQYFVNRAQWADAIDHYKVIVAKQPENAAALNNLAWALHQAKEPNALETAEKAYALAPKAPAILDTFGVILVERGQAERGLQFLRQVVAAAPKAPEARMHLAEALVKTGDKSGARVELDTLLKDTPEGPIADKARKLRAELG